jgi:transposase
VSADGAVPIHFKVADGNTEDSTTHIETWDVLRRLVGNPDFLYVADCKLCTRENLRYIDNAHGWFITLLPRSRREDGIFRDWLQQNVPAWEEIELSRRPRLKDGVVEVVKAIESPIPDVDGYRLIWVFSSLKKERDFLARKGFMERAFKELEVLRQKLLGARCRITSRATVARAADSILANAAAGRWIGYQIAEVDKCTFRQEKRGRSGKDTRWRRTIKLRFELTITSNADNIAYDSKCDGIFPLITNRKNLLLRDVIEAYKCKQPMIEQRHDLLKNVEDAAPVFLKNIGRIEALLFLDYVALTVHALIEREMRREMSSNGVQELPLYPERRRCQAPTADRILEVFDGLADAGAFSVWPVSSHCIHSICHCKYPCKKWYSLAFKTIRIACSVVKLMVVFYSRDDVF